MDPNPVIAQNLVNREFAKRLKKLIIFKRPESSTKGLFRAIPQVTPPIRYLIAERRDRGFFPRQEGY